MSRLILTPAFYFSFYTSKQGAFLPLVISTLIFACLELTDLLDGYLARRNKQITDFGKLMDPFADSISRFTVFFTIYASGLMIPVDWGYFAEKAAGIFILIFFYRDAGNFMVRIIGISHKNVISARFSGKLKAILQAIAIGTCLFLLYLFQFGIISDLEMMKKTVFCIVGTASITTGISGIDYWWANRGLINKLKM